jgi:hypothetical protein
MDMFDEGPIAAATAATGVRREGVELLLRLPGGGLACLEIVKLPPGEAAGLPASAPGRVDFGDGITLLVRAPG